MEQKIMSLSKIQQAFACLDSKLSHSLQLIMGGGGAMICAHHFPLATTDVDAIAIGTDIHSLNNLISEVAAEIELPADWLNFHFSSFAFVVLPDYLDHTINVYTGTHLTVRAFSLEDMLILKCFAHRPKDVVHSKALLKKNPDLKKIEAHIEMLKSKGFPEAQKALDFLDEVLDQE
jgi:hypothetical protein